MYVCKRLRASEDAQPQSLDVSSDKAASTARQTEQTCVWQSILQIGKGDAGYVWQQNAHKHDDAGVRGDADVR